MIRRLVELELQAFRSILQHQIVPLDADVVLLYGLNGAGKSGILAAIEFAITGEVSDLARFGEDYPRCLTHVRSGSPGMTSVEFYNEQGERLRVQHRVGSEEVGLPLTRAEQKSYTERSFLSQARLHRLIDSYLDADESGMEQRLVRFGRELLGLGVLEDLATGLFDIADVRRIRNSSQGYQQLLAEKEVADEAVDRLERLVKLRAESFETALQSFRNFAGEYSSDVSADLVALGRDVEIKEGARSVERTKRLAQLRDLYARLETSIAVLTASIAGQQGSLDDLRNRLDVLRKQKSEIEWKLEPALEGLRDDLIAEDLWVVDDLEEQEKTSKIDELENVLRRRIGSFDPELRSIDDLDRERKDLEVRLAGVTATLALLSEITPGNVQERRQWVEVLRTIASRVHSNDCPVCGRDYSEVGAGSLKDKVLLEAEEIARALQAAEKDLLSRTSLQAEQRELARRLESLTSQTERSGQRRQELQRVVARYRHRMAIISSTVDLRSRLQALVTDIKNHESNILENQIRMDRRAQAEAEIQAIAIDPVLAGDARAIPVVLLDDAHNVRGRISAQISALHAEESRSSQVLESAKLTQSLEDDLKQLKLQLSEAQARQGMLEKGCAQVESIIQRARALRTVAIETKTQLLTQAFTGTLNRLWKELFDRLARAERFYPEMTEPATVRNVVRTGIRAVAPNVEPFAHIGSVLSSGNLNTAALSLFLALHVLDRTSHSVLVLDDPVQSVDDVHVSQMAILLRALIAQIGRQVIIAVHDQDLFDYLSLELTPIEKGRTLRTVELQRTGPEADIQVINKLKQWTPSIRFGT